MVETVLKFLFAENNAILSPCSRHYNFNLFPLFYSLLLLTALHHRFMALSFAREAALYSPIPALLSVPSIPVAMLSALSPLPPPSLLLPNLPPSSSMALPLLKSSTSLSMDLKYCSIATIKLVPRSCLPSTTMKIKLLV